jgi:hypothetical protein
MPRSRRIADGPSARINKGWHRPHWNPVQQTGTPRRRAAGCRAKPSSSTLATAKSGRKQAPGARGGLELVSTDPGANAAFGNVGIGMPYGLANSEPAVVGQRTTPADQLPTWQKNWCAWWICRPSSLTPPVPHPGRPVTAMHQWRFRLWRARSMMHDAASDDMWLRRRHTLAVGLASWSRKNSCDRATNTSLRRISRGRQLRVAPGYTRTNVRCDVMVSDQSSRLPHSRHVPPRSDPRHIHPPLSLHR